MNKISPEEEFKVESEVFNNRAERFKLIFNASPDMIFILSHNGRILDANQAALDVYEYGHKDVFGMNFEKLLADNAMSKGAHKLFDSAQRGNEIEYEWVTKTRTGKIVPVDIRLRSLKLEKEEEASAVVLILRDTSLKQKADEAIQSLARATNILEFEAFLKESMCSLADLYGTKFAFVGRLLPDNKTIRTLVVRAGDQFVDNFTYALDDTPCEDVMNMTSAFISDNACELYPKDELLMQMGVRSYFGVSMVAEEKKMGLVVLMDDKPLVVEEWAEPILEVFANRLAVEVERFEITQELKENKEQLEAQVAERTSELEAANKELHAFNASVAHDLRTPINVISSYCQILYSEFAETLSGTAEESLASIKETAFNMSNKIDDMLQMSRASQAEIEKEDVSLSLIAEEILQKLSYLNQERIIKFEIEEDMSCYADRGEMIILLDNLLSNAWKFTANTDAGFIKVGKTQKNNEDCFFIQDNGAGFDMSDAEKLYEPFKRLHKESEFSGTGIGLTTVSRIVKKHGGRIWAEAEVNKGATFFITLPNKI